jgi:protein subunit release factor B
MAEVRRSRYGVSAEKEAALDARLAELGVREEDLVEKFVRASGPGGQKVNKTSTAVHLKHLPSGTEVKAQTARSQSLNRYHARRRLADKLEEEIEGKKSAAQQEREKIRRQKRRRSRRAKAKMIANKRIQGEKKRQRGKPKVEE